MTVPLKVNYWAGGSAANGIDYARLPTSVTIPAGAATADVFVNPVDDKIVEGTEKVLVTITASKFYTLDSPMAARVTITDND